MKAALPLLTGILWLGTFRADNAEGQPPDFVKAVLPVITKHCLDCHSTGKHKGDLDLESIASPEGLRRHPKIWQQVLEQINVGEMPPKEKPQPAPDEKSRLTAWVRGSLNALAMEQAGDPGPVMLRRLSNAEYSWTIRDLTGVPSLDPAREFPVDGAAGEGFSNAGQALVMSPSLVVKYLDAAKKIASHAVLAPDGIRFSEGTTRQDWTAEILANIKECYQRYSGSGGTLPLERYLRATVEWRNGSREVAELAARHHLSAKYLGSLLSVLSAGQPSPLLDPLRRQWAAAHAGEVPALAAGIGQWQKTLWKFSSVGHIGKTGGAKAWMEPVTPLVSGQEFHLKLPAGENAGEAVLYLTAGDAGDGDGGDFVIWKQPEIRLPGRPPILLRDLRGLIPALKSRRERALAGIPGILAAAAEAEASQKPIDLPASPAESGWGLDPARFGRHPNGSLIDAASLCVQAPSIIEVRLPAELAQGSEFITAAALDPVTGADGSVQLQVLTTKPAPLPGVGPGGTALAAEDGSGKSGRGGMVIGIPVVAQAGGAAHRKFESTFEEFRRMFPAALCYDKIVPVDETVTLTLFHREDEPFSRLMLEEKEATLLGKLWDDLRFVSEDSLSLVDAFDQIWQFSTQDGPDAPNGDERLKPLGVKIKEQAAVFRQQLLDAEPRHLESVLEFASRAWRRPLTDREQAELRALYRQWRTQELPHDEAIRLTLARILTGPAFLYRMERQEPGLQATPVNDWELAVRLSYFLWSSAPDAELSSLAAAGTLRQPAVLAHQTRRMLAHPAVRRLAVEFAAAWLHLHDFESLDEKSERHFPEFKDLRGAMYEEVIRFFTDFFQENRSIPSILDADHTFLNEPLARHYGINGIAGDQWRRVDGLRGYSRGGILGFAAPLSKQSGASRTSPILRGNWVAEVLLGDRLPRPPKNVPRLPGEESNTSLTMRGLTEKHSSDPRCYGCHQRIDAFGFALEHFDAIGRHRLQDQNGRPADARAKTMDGTELDGIDGLRTYLLTQKRGAFLGQFCRKLLGYALGRSVQLSDEPLLTAMQTRLAADGYPIHTAIAMIVGSRQFLEIRGRDAAFEE